MTEISAMQETINRLNEHVGDLTVALENANEGNEKLLAIARDLNAANVELKQKIARLEANKPRTIYPWKAE